MAIAFRSVGAVAGADSGNVASIGLPAGHAADDLLILTAVQFDNVASTVSGYTLLSSHTNGANMTVRVFGKFDSGSEAAPTLTHSGGATTSCQIAAYSGVDPSLGLGVGAGQVLRDVQSSTGSGTGTLTITTPALSGLQSGDMRVVIAAHACSDTSGAATTNFSAPTSFAERADTGRVGATSSVCHALDDFLSNALAATSQTGNGIGFAGTLSWIGVQLAITGVPPAGPIVEATAETAVSTAGTSHAVTLPAGLAAGDLILLVADIGSTAATLNALAGWTELLDENLANGLKVLYKVAAGGDSNPTFTSSAATRSAWVAYRISGAIDPATQAPEIGTTASGSSVNPNPPAVTPTGGAKDYLWIAFFGRGGEEADDDTWTTAAPASFGTLLQKACGTAGVNLGGMVASAHANINAASQDPGTFTCATGAWRAQTIAVHPAASGTSETPGRGGAAALGTAPGASAAAPLGGAAAQGTAPGPRAPAGVGAAAAQGLAPSARADVQPGGAAAGGTAPSEPAGGISETPTPGGALAAGIAPAARAASPLGGAAAAGTGPASRAPAPLGGAAAQGAAPAARASAQAGGAAALGSAPVVRVATPVGGALAQGSGPAARVSVSIGGALAGGQLTDPLTGGTSDTPTPGGALAGGRAPATSTATPLGGAAAGGAPAGARVSATIGGAAAGATAPAPAAPIPLGGSIARGIAPPGVRASLLPGAARAGGQLEDPLTFVLTLVHFGRPSPAGGSGAGSPSAASFGPGSPAGGAGAGSPEAARFGPPSPSKVGV